MKGNTVTLLRCQSADSGLPILILSCSVPELSKILGYHEISTNSHYTTLEHICCYSLVPSSHPCEILVPSTDHGPLHIKTTKLQCKPIKQTKGIFHLFGKLHAAAKINKTCPFKDGKSNVCNVDPVWCVKRSNVVEQFCGQRN